MQFAAQLRAARALMDWSQEECGKILGISHQTIGNIESEQNKPSKATVEKVLKAFANHGIELIGQHRLMGVVLIKNEPENSPQRGDKQ
jgi:DNA-binding XRE family transcriptional regulator